MSGTTREMHIWNSTCWQYTVDIRKLFTISRQMASIVRMYSVIQKTWRWRWRWDLFVNNTTTTTPQLFYGPFLGPPR